MKWYRLALSLLLLVAVLWLWSTRYDELVYHTLVESQAIDLGDATSFAKNREIAAPNSFVSIQGVLGTKAATLSGLREGSFRFGRYQVRNLLGSKLYLEYDEEKYRDEFNPFTKVEVTGRLVSFAKGSELEKVRKFFKNYYNRAVDDNAMLIVVDEKPRSEFRYPLLFLFSLVIVLLSFFFSVRLFSRRN